MRLIELPVLTLYKDSKSKEETLLRVEEFIWKILIEDDMNKQGLQQCKEELDRMNPKEDNINKPEIQWQDEELSR